MKNTLHLTFLLCIFTLAAQATRGQTYLSTQSCPSGYEAYDAFKSVVNSTQYRCYGKPSARWITYACPNSTRCNGTYVKQEFCYHGKTVNLYYTESECTCGCVGKNFHGKNLNILDIEPCDCPDAKIGTDW